MSHFKIERVGAQTEDERPFVTLTLSRRGAERLRGLLGSVCIGRVDADLEAVYNTLGMMGVDFDPEVDRLSGEDQRRRYGAMR